MATSVDWVTGVITILQADMTPLGGDVYELDIDVLRLDLKALEDVADEGAAWLRTHDHNTEVVISGITYARTFEIINGYTVTISPATAYQVSCIGANHNVQDVYNNLTGPTLLPNNAAGLISSAVLSTEQDTRLAEVHAIHGLKSGSPLTVTASARAADGIAQTVDEAAGTVTVTRT